MLVLLFFGIGHDVAIVFLLLLLLLHVLLFVFVSFVVCSLPVLLCVLFVRVLVLVL